MEEARKAPAYLSAQELLQFSIFPEEARHLQNVDCNNYQAVEFALRSAGMNRSLRERVMGDMYKAGYIQDWPMGEFISTGK